MSREYAEPEMEVSIGAAKLKAVEEEMRHAEEIFDRLSGTLGRQREILIGIREHADALLGCEPESPKTSENEVMPDAFIDKIREYLNDINEVQSETRHHLGRLSRF